MTNFENLIEKYSLSTYAVFLCLFCSMMFASVVIFIGYATLPDRKKLSWVLSLTNSLFMTCAGAFYCLLKFLRKDSIFIWGEEDFLGLDNYSAVTCIVFAVMNASDLIFGLIFYKEHLGVLTAYFHHTIYIWLMIYAITGNGGFTSTTPFCEGFMWSSIEELPTSLLALGSIFPSLRSDIGFGLSFFLLRIIYHSFLTYQAVQIVNAYGFACVGMYFLTLAMHVNWFYTWFTKYGMRLLKGGGIQRKEKQ